MAIALDSNLTANLSPALRAARVNAVCPSKAAVRAGNLVEGLRSPRNPSHPPHKAAGAHFPAGDGLRPAGAREWEHPPMVGQRQRFARRDMGRHAPLREAA